MYKVINYLLLLFISIAIIFLLISEDSKKDYKSVFAQINIPTQFSLYQNDEYNFEIEHPSDWQQFGDVEAGDYTQHIAIFVPKDEIKFKEFDSTKDYYKMNTRVAIFLDYSYLLPKLNRNFVLDDAINAYSGNTEGFKKFELLESDSNSKLSDRLAYKIVFQFKHKGDYIKYIELGTIINDNQVLVLNLKAKADEFDILLPTFQHMINSFKIGSLETKTTNNNNNSVNEYSSTFNELPIEEIFGKNDNS